MTTSAFNMLPVGCLDGGRAVQVYLLAWGWKSRSIRVSLVVKVMLAAMTIRRTDALAAFLF